MHSRQGLYNRIGERVGRVVDAMPRSGWWFLNKNNAFLTTDVRRLALSMEPTRHGFLPAKRLHECTRSHKSVHGCRHRNPKHNGKCKLHARQDGECKLHVLAHKRLTSSTTLSRASGMGLMCAASSLSATLGSRNNSLGQQVLR
jgi:hypothetical protein